jgi:predicted metal-dependent phosphoesterase TrpH
MERCELHLHTEYSRDCSTSLPTVMKACKRRGITTLFVTDHNEIEGARRLQTHAPFRVVLSEEITTSEGEIIGYFLHDRIRPGLSPEETIREIRRQGGIVSIPHPFDRLRHSAIRREALDRILPMVDLIEVFNARNVFPSDDKRAEQYAHEKKKIPVVVSDAHSRWEIGRSTVELVAFDSPQTFLRAMTNATMRHKRSPIIVHAITKYNKLRARLHLKEG